jgi:hypothetical protein
MKSSKSAPSRRSRISLDQLEDRRRKKNQSSINQLKPWKPVLDCLLTAPDDDHWNYASPKGRARFKLWYRTDHGRGYNKSSSRRAFKTPMRLWVKFRRTSSHGSLEVTGASVVGFINWWWDSPERESGKPYDTMKGYLKHLSNLQFMQKAVQLDVSTLKAAKPASLFDDPDVQDVLQDLKQAQELMQIRWAAVLRGPVGMLMLTTPVPVRAQ